MTNEVPHVLQSLETDMDVDADHPLTVERAGGRIVEGCNMRMIIIQQLTIGHDIINYIHTDAVRTSPIARSLSHVRPGFKSGDQETWQHAYSHPLGPRLNLNQKQRDWRLTIRGTYDIALASPFFFSFPVLKNGGNFYS
jgi:hypothetical protein